MQTKRLHFITLATLLISAFVLRAWDASSMSVEHFDEGVYASNLFSDHIGFRYPDRQFYAPPLFPAILEWTLIFWGANPHAVMWVNVILGTLLVAAVYWTATELIRFPPSPPGRPAAGENVTRSSGFDQMVGAAAMASAAIIAFSDLFIQYSRAALTDIPVCLWMTFAVGAGARSFRTGSWGWAIFSGVLTALAWWTKYNGWLPLAILAAGLAGWFLFTPEGRRSFAPRKTELKGSSKRKKQLSPRVSATSPNGFSLALKWIVIAAVAGLLWLPYLNELQAKGGYASVAANHRSYIVGLSGWLGSVIRHLQVDHFYSGWSSAAGIFVAILVAWWFTELNLKRELQTPFLSLWEKVRIGLVMLLPLFASFFGLIPTLIVGAVLVVAVLRRFPKNDEGLLSVPLGFWFLIAWIAGLTLATPMYRPYPRLILPWMIAMSIAAGWGISISLSVFKASLSDAAASLLNGPTSRGAAWQPIVLWSVILVFPFLAISTRPVFLADRNGLKKGASEILDRISEDLTEQPKSQLEHLDFVIYVVGEPGLYYHLAALEDLNFKFITQPASDLGMLTSGKVDARVPAYVVTGPHSKKESVELSRLTKQVRLVRVSHESPGKEGADYRPSDLVLLDDYAPRDLEKHRAERLQLWAIELP